ncbi:hypothetical protein PR202_gb28574 [Eleusine coracana subsp. coracana]|uniref:F-box domain-containing protein n=1 Tax=Eleusine coracana subsp. coracana TaxID=191504 RepID=A0AAV5FX65_ELECO|nr:hypothetical protein PR202_gb28574 [Eleusine coracana subsp. coracana]
MPSTTLCLGIMEPPSPASATETLETRDWSALPRDILLGVLLKLGPCEIMQGAELVCTTWRHAAVEEPSLWRHIDMGTDSVRLAVARAAVDRSAGQCEAFSSGICNHDLLFYLVERAPYLKSLRLPSFQGSKEILIVVLEKLPFLEDLEISASQSNTVTEDLFESLCEASCLLRKLTLRFGRELVRKTITGKIPMMSELRCLELFDCYLSAEGLTTILDCCPLLESLHIEGYFDSEIEGDLREKCARVKNLILPTSENDSEEDWDEWNTDDQFYQIYQQSWDDYNKFNGIDHWGIDCHPQYYYLHDELHSDNYEISLDGPAGWW